MRWTLWLVAICAAASVVDLSPAEAQRVYVNSNGGAGGDAAMVMNVSVIDADPASPSYHTILATLDNATVGFPVGGGAGVAVTPDRTRVYFVDAGFQLSMIATATNTVVDLDPDPTLGKHGIPLMDTFGTHGGAGLAITPDGTRALVSGCDFPSFTTTGIRIIDVDPESPTFHTTLTTIDIAGGCPYDVTFDRTGTRAYVSHRSRTFVSVIDLATHVVTNLTLPGVGLLPTPSVVTLTPDGTRAYVIYRNFLFAIDTATNTFLDLDPSTSAHHRILNCSLASTGAEAIAITPDGTRAYVVCRATNITAPSAILVKVVDLDPSSSTYLAVSEILQFGFFSGNFGQVYGAQLVRITPDGTRAYVGTGSRVHAVDLVPSSPTYHQVVASIVKPGMAGGMAILSAPENQAPVADAGPDQQVVQLGTLVQLDGSQSFDDDGDDIAYAWSLVQRPGGSAASLSDATAVDPTFVADVQGEYRARLVVIDEFGAASEADEVVVSFLNVAPVADAGDNQAVLVGTTVQLDGSGSSDANLDPLTYQWSITTQPDGSGATLSDGTAPAPTFVPDLPGTYTVSLVVNDGQAASAPGVITIQATMQADAIVAELTDAIAAVNALGPGDLRNPNMAKALASKLLAVIADVEAGHLRDALDKLEHDVLAKTDGCAAGGAPDRNDWLKTCAAQEPLYALLAAAADLLRAALD